MKLDRWLLLASLAGCVGEAPPEPPDPGDGSGGDLIEDPHALTGCNSVTTVLLYSESVWELELPHAFAAVQDACTRYYVTLPHLEDPTMPRPGAAEVHALGPNFHAVAEFSWFGWAEWIAASPGTRTWELAGKTFRQRMIDAGYDVAAGDIWAINEFPLETASGSENIWVKESNAVRGLYQGDGSSPVQGIVYMAGVGQGHQNFADYKADVKTWLTQDAWWTAMASYVRWFSLEVYADPHYDCVVDSNVAADAANLNAYVEHLPRLAEAGGASAHIAAAYLDKAYAPLLNAAWNSNKGFGNNLVSLPAFEKFSRLQVYAQHVWAANHAFPGRRLGFAWSPSDSTQAQRAELSSAMAGSVQRSYPPNAFYGLGQFACASDGALSECGCQVAGGYNPGWSAFATW